MVYKTLDDVNVSEGLQVFFVLANDITNGLFINLFVFGFLMVATLGSYYSQQRLTQNASFPNSFAVGSFLTVILAVLLSLISDLMPMYTLLITIGLSVLGLFWVFMSSKE